MNFYELVDEINTEGQNQNWDNLPYSFNQLNRAKLEDTSDLEIFDIVRKAYEITIIYRIDCRDSDSKFEYRKYGNEGLFPFEETELSLLNGLDWTRLPHSLKAHIYDVIWLCNHKYEAAKTAAEEYYKLYHEWFDEENWVQCVDYISRAIELVAKIGNNEKKEEFLAEIYNDIVRLNGNDSSFLSISLIELIIYQNYHCDFKALIPLVDKLISKNEGNIENANLMEQAYYVKASIYKKLKDSISEHNVLVKYADVLVRDAEKYLKATDDESIVDNRNWFMAENNIKKAIELYQNHGVSKKAIDAQKLLLEIQKNVVKHMPMHKFKCDVSGFYKKYSSEYENHDIQELLWDVVFSFGFQNKQQIREDIIKNSSPFFSLFPIHILGSEGQTEFLLPSLQLNDENNVLLHMYHKARENETIQGQTMGVWFIQYFRKRNLQETDLNIFFEDNPIIPKGQEKDVQRGIYYGLTGHMSDALDKLVPKVHIAKLIGRVCGAKRPHSVSKQPIIIVFE